MILLFFMPLFLFLLIIMVKNSRYEHRIENEHRKPVLIGSAFVILAFCIEALISVYSNSAMLGVYRNAYNFNNAVCSFGLITGTRLDIQYDIFGDPSAAEFVMQQPEDSLSYIEEGSSTTDEESLEQTEEPPTLYRLANNGIKFTDFYQPTWGGSTSTGEYSILTGLVPTAGVSSILKIADCDLSFTIGNRLKNEGYFSAAYHDGTYTYYSRNLTHTKFGYDTFTAFGNGLEKGVNTNVWPASDLEVRQ